MYWPFFLQAINMQTELVSETQAVDADKIGVRVGKLAKQAKVPIAIVSTITQVSVVTVYRWYRGESDPNTTANKRKLRRLEWTLTQALAQGILPDTDKFDPAAILPLWNESKSNKQTTTV